MSKLLIEREMIELTQQKTKMIKSGWGDEAIEGSTVEKITYLSDGLKVKGFIAYPNNGKEKYPCIIWCRGGIGDAGTIDNFNARGIFGQLASWGYVVFASQYRGNDGGEGHDNFGGDDVNDILNLVSLAGEFPQADTSKWAIEGWSRGGMMTYLALTKTNIFRTAVIIGGIANLKCTADESPFMKKLFEHYAAKDTFHDLSEICQTRSIINFPDKLPRETSLLILHGTNDNRVPAHDSIDLSYKLLENKIPFRMILYDNGDHFLKAHRKEVDELRKNWYERYLL